MKINYNLKLDKQSKNKAEKIYAKLDVPLWAAINVFLKASIKAKGFPFKITAKLLYNKETIKALNEAKKIANDSNAKSFDSVEELIKDLMK